MAVNLNSRSETRENINKQIERETAIKFKIFDALCVLVALAVSGSSGTMTTCRTCRPSMTS